MNVSLCEHGRWAENCVICRRQRAFGQFGVFFVLCVLWGAIVLLIRWLIR